jgi:hypothetical protein
VIALLILVVGGLLAAWRFGPPDHGGVEVELLGACQARERRPRHD